MWLSNSKGKQIAVPFLRNVYAKGKLIIAIAIEVGHENDLQFCALCFLTSSKGRESKK